MESRPPPHSKIPKRNTIPPTLSGRGQDYLHCDPRTSSSPVSSPRQISFGLKSGSIAGSKIPKKSRTPNQRYAQERETDHHVPTKVIVKTKQAGSDLIDVLGECQVGTGEGDTPPATIMDPLSGSVSTNTMFIKKDAPSLNNTPANEEISKEEVNHALVGLILPTSDHNIFNSLHISTIMDAETLDAIKPPEVVQHDNKAQEQLLLVQESVSALAHCPNTSNTTIGTTLQKNSFTIVQKLTPLVHPSIDLLKAAALFPSLESSRNVIPSAELQGIVHEQAEGLFNNLAHEAARKAAISQCMRDEISNNGISDAEEAKNKEEDLPIPTARALSLCITDKTIVCTNEKSERSPSMFSFPKDASKITSLSSVATVKPTSTASEKCIYSTCPSVTSVVDLAKPADDDYSLLFDDLVMELGEPTKSDHELMKQIEAEAEMENLPEAKPSLDQLQNNFRLREYYKIFHESMTGITPGQETSESVISFSTVEATQGLELEPKLMLEPAVEPELMLEQANETEQLLELVPARKPEQLLEREPSGEPELMLEQANETEQLLQLEPTGKPEPVLRLNQANETEQMQGNPGAETGNESDATEERFDDDYSDYSFSYTDESESEEEESRKLEIEAGEVAINNLENLNHNYGMINKKARTIFSVDIRLSQVDVQSGPGENGDGHHHDDEDFLSRKTHSVVHAESISNHPEVTSKETVKNPTPICHLPSVNNLESLKTQESSTSIHSLYSRKNINGKWMTKNAMNGNSEKWTELKSQKNSSSDEEPGNMKDVIDLRNKNPFYEKPKQLPMCEAIVSRSLILQNNGNISDMFCRLIPLNNPTSSLYAFKISYNNASDRIIVTPDIGLLPPRTNVLVEIGVKENLRKIQLRDNVSIKEKIKINIFPTSCTDDDPRMLAQEYQKIVDQCPGLIHMQSIDRIIFWGDGKLEEKLNLFNSIKNRDELLKLKEELHLYHDRSRSHITRSNNDSCTKLLLISVKRELLRANAHFKEIFCEMACFRTGQFFVQLICVGILILSVIYLINLPTNEPTKPPPKSSWW